MPLFYEKIMAIVVKRILAVLQRSTFLQMFLLNRILGLILFDIKDFKEIREITRYHSRKDSLPML